MKVAIAIAAGLAAAALTFVLLPLATQAALSLLQNRFPKCVWEAVNPYGIIVLGGSFDGLVAPGARVLEGLTLARRFPNARVAYSGFDEAGAGTSEEYYKQEGIDPSRIVMESRSENTWENSAYLRDSLGEARGRCWILITSAIHMPRAVGAFRAQGFSVIPDPVEYLAPNDPHVWRSISKELAGLFWYRIKGYSFELFPNPNDICAKRDYSDIAFPLVMEAVGDEATPIPLVVSTHREAPAR